MTNPSRAIGPTATPKSGSTVRHPIAVLLISAISLTMLAQVVFLLNGWNVMPAKVLELLLLLGGATLLTGLAGGRREVRRLYAGLTRWRISLGAVVMVVVALPLLTVAVAIATGSLQPVKGGWVQVILLYLIFLVFGAVTANLWEETVWGGFVQGRLMARHGLLIGSILTAVPFFLIHLPLAFESKGWSGTSWKDALTTWAFLLVGAPFFRYLVGMILIDTGGSLLAAGLLHASFNASGALPVLSGGWQYVPAMIALTVAGAALRRRQGISPVQGYSRSLLTIADAQRAELHDSDACGAPTSPAAPPAAEPDAVASPGVAVGGKATAVPVAQRGGKMTRSTHDPSSWPRWPSPRLQSFGRSGAGPRRGPQELQ